MDRISWDKYFLQVCDTIASRSPCRSRKIGAIAIKDSRFIIATGYNGPSSGYPHCEGEICPRQAKGLKSGEGLEFCPAQHAERNVVCEAARLGVSLQGCSMHMNCPVPCRECAKAIVNAGISEIVVTSMIPYPESGITGADVFYKSGVRVRKFDDS